MDRVVLLLLTLRTSLALPAISLMTKVSLELARHHDVACVTLLHPAGENLALREELNAFVKSVSAEPRFMTSLYSYPRYIAFKKSITRNSCMKPLKLFYDGMNGHAVGTRGGFTQISKKFNMAQSIWVIFSNSSADEFFAGASVPFNTEVLLARLHPEAARVDLHEVYRVRADMPLRVSLTGNWTEDEGLSVPRGSIYHRRTNLEGVVLRTGSLENWPMSTFHGLDFGSEEWDGYYPRVWRELERIMNCTSVAVLSTDNSTGVLENGQYNGLVGMTLREEIDVVVSELSLSKDRSHFLDFSHPLSISRYQIYYRHPGYSLEWTAVFKPFSRNVWLAIVLWMLIGASSLSFCYTYCARYEMEDPRYAKDRAAAFFFMLRTLCQQGSAFVPRSAVCRLIFLASYVASAIIIPSYSASLVSSLTNQSPSRPFDSLAAMLEDGRYKLLVGRNTAEYSLFSNATDTLYEQVYKKLMKTIPESEVQNSSLLALLTLCNKTNYAVYGIEEIVNLRLQLIRPACTIISFSRPLSRVYQSMGLIKGSHYSGIINHHLQRMFDVGIVDRIRKSVWPRANDLEQHWTQVHVEEVSQIFVYLVLGMLLSVVVFVCEVFVSCTTSAPRPPPKGHHLDPVYVISFDFYD